MSVTAFIKRCLDAGMPVDMALAASEAFEAEVSLMGSTPSETRRLEKQRARQAKYAEKKRQGASSDVTLTSVASETSEVAKEIPPTPPKENNPSPPLKGGISPEIPASRPEKPKAKTIGDWVAEIWEITPKPGRERSGRAALETSLKAAAKRGDDLAAVRDGLAGYYASGDATKDGGKFAQGVHVAVKTGRWEAFVERPKPVAGSVIEADPWPKRLREFQRNGYWNTTDWGPKPGKEGCRAPVMIPADGAAAEGRAA